MSWVDRYRADVSWGDQIHSDDNDRSCWVMVDGQRHHTRSGYFCNRDRACRIALARAHQLQTSRMTVMWLDEQLTEAQVEELLFLCRDYGLGCGFLEPQPQVHHYGLLVRHSEGTILDRAAELLGTTWDKSN